MIKTATKMCSKLIVVFALFIISTVSGLAFSVQKRTAVADNQQDLPDYTLGVKYDEYPLVVPKKRAAILFDRLMVALQKAIEEEEEEANRLSNRSPASFRPEEGMDLQRRGHGNMGGQQKGRVYWRCYFNAVTCF